MSEKELKQFRSMNSMLRYIDRRKWLPPTHRAAMVMLDYDEYDEYMPPFFINPAIGLLIDNMEVVVLPESLLGAQWQQNILPTLCMSRRVENKAVHDVVVGNWFIKTIIPKFIRDCPTTTFYEDFIVALNQLTKEDTDWGDVLEEARTSLLLHNSDVDLEWWLVRMFCPQAKQVYHSSKEGKYYSTPSLVFTAVDSLVHAAETSRFDHLFNWETLHVHGLMVDLMQLVKNTASNHLVIGDTKIQKTKNGGVGITQRMTDVSVYDQILLTSSAARKVANWILNNTEETDEEVNHSLY